MLPGSNVSAPVKYFPYWSTKAKDTVYRAMSDGFVCARTTGISEVEGRTDGSNPPTTARNINEGHVAADQCGITMPVKKGDYWKVINADLSVFWIPLRP